MLLSIDLGGTKTMVGIISSKGKILAKKSFPTDKKSQPDEHLYLTLKKLDDLIEEKNIKHDEIEGLGVAVPGLADRESGVLIRAPYLNWWNIPVRDILLKNWPGLDIEIANDVNACALGELYFGAGRKYKSFLWITVSTGIGAGVVLNRNLFYGEDGLAGELGHIIVEWGKGRKCTCGNYGCLEAQASGKAIAAMAKKYPEIRKYLKSNNREITAEEVAKAAYKDCPEAKAVYYKAGKYLGRALSSAVNLFNPGCIIIGGGVSRSLDLLRPGIEKDLYPNVIGDENKKVPVLKTELGYEAALLGGAALIIDSREMG